MKKLIFKKKLSKTIRNLTFIYFILLLFASLILIPLKSYSLVSLLAFGLIYVGMIAFAASLFLRKKWWILGAILTADTLLLLDLSESNLNIGKNLLFIVIFTIILPSLAFLFFYIIRKIEEKQEERQTRIREEERRKRICAEEERICAEEERICAEVLQERIRKKPYEDIKESEERISEWEAHLENKPFDHRAKKKLALCKIILYFEFINLKERIRTKNESSWHDDFYSKKSHLLVEANVLYDDYLKHYPGDAEAHNNNANCLYLLDRPKEALIFINKAIKLNPNNKDYKKRKENIMKNINSNDDFENVVEQSKTIETKKGLLVQSKGEQLIADFLDDNNIDYDYDSQITLKHNENNKQGHDKSWERPDFYLTEFRIIIEYWGLKGTPDYDKKMEEKKRVYKESGQRFISITPEDLPELEEKLKTKLKRLGVNID